MLGINVIKLRKNSMQMMISSIKEKTSFEHTLFANTHTCSLMDHCIKPNDAYIFALSSRNCTKSHNVTARCKQQDISAHDISKSYLCHKEIYRQIHHKHKATFTVTFDIELLERYGFKRVYLLDCLKVRIMSTLKVPLNLFD